MSNVMIRFAIAIILLGFLSLLSCSNSFSPDPELITSNFRSDRKAIGRTEKLRVLVDKVLMKSNGWVMTEDHVRQIAEAGFNVVTPRVGGDDMNRVRRIAGLALKYNMFYMPWMRGTLKAKKGPKLLWANGVEQDICSPNSDELWEWMSRRILAYAKISTEIPSLMGVFMDFENYSPGGQGNDAYPLSYDDKILKEFAKAKSIEIPKLKPKKRYKWLIDNDLHESFENFQIESWRKRCRELRQAVDAINPDFQFCAGPAPGPLFLQEAVYQEWSTDRAPLILADPYTYGRPSKGMLHMAALKFNRERLINHMNLVKEKGITFFFMGGIDPSVIGADPEFSARNAVMLSEISNGYWVFYEGPQIGKKHEDYFRWFKRANKAILERRFDFWRENRETKEYWQKSGK